MRPASNRFRLVMLALVLASPVGPLSIKAGESGGCMPVGVWVYPGRNERPDDVLGVLARRGVVLLGESHNEAEHHRWQLHTIAGLVSELAGRIPRKGETVEEDGLRFEVLESTDRKVERVRVTAVQPQQLKLLAFPRLHWRPCPGWL